MVPTAISQVLEQLVNIFFTLLLAYLLIKKGLPAACAGGSFATSLAAIVAAIFLIFMYKHYNESRIVKYHDVNVKRYTNFELIKKILNYSIPLTVYQALFYIGNLIDVGNTHSRLMHAGFSDNIAITILW